MSQYQESMAFEAEVRKVAEAVWNLASGECKPKHYDDPVVKELDGIARLHDVIHLIMATTSRKLEKAKEDAKKLRAAEAFERKTANQVGITKWFITQHELDAKILNFLKSENIKSLTLDQFRRRYFDAHGYISKRRNASFGSARNPKDNSTNLPEDLYVEAPIYVEERREARRKDDVIVEIHRTETNIKRISERLFSGENFILLAPFGSGKSLTTRELFEVFARKYEQTGITPIAINLREHWGQGYFDEILERHARSIGFSPKEHLVSAWRAGMACLLIDGFDEVASSAIVRRDDVNFMREARRVALQGVKDFVAKLPPGIGIWICGRDHYFDSEREMVNALGLSGRPYTVLGLGEFTEEGAKKFLSSQGVVEELPAWLPRKPLLLGYLIQNKLIDEVLKIDGTKGFGQVWDEFLTKIAQRESELERSVMDPLTVRNVMERLSVYVRSLPQGSGPVGGPDLARMYQEETGQVATDGVLAQLQRLPGLTERENEPGYRSFVDEDFLAALQGSAFARSILSGGKFPRITPIHALSTRARMMAAFLLDHGKISCDTLIAMAERITQKTEDMSKQMSAQIAADCLSVAMDMAISNERAVLNCNGLIIDEAEIGVIDLEQLEVVSIDIRRSNISDLLIGQLGINSRINISECIIGRVNGVSNEALLPSGVRFSHTEVGDYAYATTVSAIMRGSYPPQIKALVSVLKKVYKQAGSGRQLSALKRGITAPDVNNYIDGVIDVLDSEGLVYRYNNVVHPVRKFSNRVEAILGAPMISKDIVVTRINQL